MATVASELLVGRRAMNQKGELFGCAARSRAPRTAARRRGSPNSTSRCAACGMTTPATCGARTPRASCTGARATAPTRRGSASPASRSEPTRKRTRRLASRTSWQTPTRCGRCAVASVSTHVPRHTQRISRPSCRTTRRSTARPHPGARPGSASRRTKPSAARAWRNSARRSRPSTRKMLAAPGLQRAWPNLVCILQCALQAALSRATRGGFYERGKSTGVLRSRYIQNSRKRCFSFDDKAPA